MGWLKDLLILLAMMLGISAIGMGPRAEPGAGDVRSLVRIHLDSCPECRAERGHLDCPVMQAILRSITRRMLEENPWMCVIEAGGMPGPAPPAPAAPTTHE